jgi:molybdopterin-binding protein
MKLSARNQLKGRVIDIGGGATAIAIVKISDVTGAK